MSLECPKMVLVIRLFEKEKIRNINFPDLNDDSWIDLKINSPCESNSNVFFIKNEIDKKIDKSIYLKNLPFQVRSKWYHVFLNEYIDEHKITHWMEIS